MRRTQAGVPGDGAGGDVVRIFLDVRGVVWSGGGGISRGDFGWIGARECPGLCVGVRGWFAGT